MNSAPRNLFPNPSDEQVGKYGRMFDEIERILSENPEMESKSILYKTETINRLQKYARVEVLALDENNPKTYQGVWAVECMLAYMRKHNIDFTKEELPTLWKIWIDNSIDILDINQYSLLERERDTNLYTYIAYYTEVLEEFFYKSREEKSLADIRELNEKLKYAHNEILSILGNDYGIILDINKYLFRFRMSKDLPIQRKRLKRVLEILREFAIPVSDIFLLLTDLYIRVNSLLEER